MYSISIHKASSQAQVLTCMHLGACQLHSQMAIYHVALPVKRWILIGADYR